MIEVKDENGAIGYQMERADYLKDIKRLVYQLADQMQDVQITINYLRASYGIMLNANVSHSGRESVQLFSGIDLVAEAVDRKAKETDDNQLSKGFEYEWVEFIQLAERNSREYRKANFDGKALYRVEGSTDE